MKPDLPTAQGNNVAKLVIVSYKDKDMVEKIEGFFATPINPESYSENVRVKYDKRKPQGKQGSDSRYKHTEARELRLEFSLDGTGTVEGYYYNQDNGKELKTVQEQLAFFRKQVYRKKGKIHRPYYLKITWGSLVFYCVMSTLDVSYSLFDDNGFPLRAKLTANFVEHVPKEKGDSSPDLSHRKSFDQSDRLDLMTYDIYRDPRYVLQVAKANNLTSFRSVKAGKTILFPPFDKTET